MELHDTPNQEVAGAPPWSNMEEDQLLGSSSPAATSLQALDDRPLSAINRLNVAEQQPRLSGAARKRLKKLVAQGTPFAQAREQALKPTWTPKSTKRPRNMEKVYFNLEDVPSELNLRELVYEKYLCVLEIIRTRTGSRVNLCGQGSGSSQWSREPLHLRVENSEKSLLERAREMAVELAKSIRLECDRFRALKQQETSQQVDKSAMLSVSPAYRQSGSFSSDMQLYSLGESSNERQISMPSTSLNVNERNPYCQSFTSEPSRRTSRFSDVPPSSITATPNLLLHLQNDIQSRLGNVEGRNGVTSLQQSGPSTSMTQEGALPPVTSTTSLAPNQSQSIDAAFQQLKQFLPASTSADSVPHISLQTTNLGLIKVQQCAHDELSLYTAIVNQLFGPFRSLNEQALSAAALRKRTFDYVRKKKELFSNQVKSLFDPTHRIHNLDPDIAFESGCFDLLSGTKELSWEAHLILLEAIANLFRKSIRIYKDVSTVGNIVTLAVAATVSYSTSDLSENPICVWRRKSPKNHYDALSFVKPQQSTLKSVKTIEKSKDALSFVKPQQSTLKSVKTIEKSKNILPPLSDSRTPVKGKAKPLIFRVATWNLEDSLLKDPFEKIDNLFSNNSTDFICIQGSYDEYNLTCTQTSNYQWQFGGRQHNRCLAFLTNKTKYVLSNFTDHGPGTISAEVSSSGNNRTFIVIGCFCPRSLAPDTYFCLLSEVIDSFPSSWPLLVLGDYGNTHFSRFPKNAAHLIGPAFLVDEMAPMSMKGALVMELAVKHQLYVISTWKTKSETPATFMEGNLKNKKLLQTSHILLRHNRCWECTGNNRQWRSTHSWHAIVTCVLTSKGKDVVKAPSIQKSINNFPATSSRFSAKPKRTLNFTVATWRIENALTRYTFEDVDSLLTDQAVSFVCMQGKMSHGMPYTETSNYCWWFGGKLLDENCLAFVLNKSKLNLNHLTEHSEGIISAEVSSCNDDRTFIVIGCFCTSPVSPDTYFHLLSELIYRFPSSSQLFVLGDFAHTHFAHFPISAAHLIGPAFVKTTVPSNKKGELVIELAVQHQLSVISTWETSSATPATCQKYCPESREKLLLQTSHILLRHTGLLECTRNMRHWFNAYSKYALVSCTIFCKNLFSIEVSS